MKVYLLRSSSPSKGVIKLGIRTFYNYYYFETTDAGFWAYRGYLSTKNHFFLIRQKSFSISKVKTLFRQKGCGVKTCQAWHRLPEKPKAPLPITNESLALLGHIKHHFVRQVETTQRKSKLTLLDWQLLPCSPQPSCIIRQLRLVITPLISTSLVLYSLSKRSHPPPLTILLLLLVSLLHMLICLCLKMSRQDQVQLPYLNNTKPGYFPRKEHYLLI